MKSRCARWIFVTLLLAAGAYYILAKTLYDWRNHDEHQFVMPGLLLIGKGLLPYSDYPHFHVPYLSLLQGFVVWLFPYKLLSLRLLTASFSLATFLLLVFLSRWLVRELNPWMRWGIAISTGAAFLTAQATESTLRFAWNHVPPAGLSVIAFWLLVLAATRKERSILLVSMAGAALACATCMRISFLLLFAPFGLSLFFMPGLGWRRRFLNAGYFSFSAILVSIPCLWLFVRAPEQALFDNFTYPKLSNVWRKYPIWSPGTATAVDPQKGLIDQNDPALQRPPLSSRWRDFQKNAIPRHIELVRLICWLGLPLLLFAAIRKSGAAYAAQLLLLVLPFIWAGTILPFRYNPQYIFPLVLWSVLIFPVGLAALPAGTWKHPGYWIQAITIIGLGTASVGQAIHSTRFPKLADLTEPGLWPAVAYHQMGRQIRDLKVQGKVLTFEPLMAVEAGLEIYPEFANGEFAFRCAHILSAEKRSRLKMVGEPDLEKFLAKDPPGAILIHKNDGPINRTIDDYAIKHGYEQKLENSRIRFLVNPAGQSSRPSAQ